MSTFADYPECLRRGEFALVRCAFDAQDDGRLAVGHLLGLRRPLRRAARDVLGARAAALIDPPLSTDPVALRRFQKPSPGFVVVPDLNAAGAFAAGDRMTLDVLLLGTTIQSIGDLLAILEHLGESGFNDDPLCFQLVAAETLGPDGRWQRFWQPARRSADAPLLLRIDQWLEASWPETVPVELVFESPARLLAGGRILRRPRFDQIFPFILRRVTAMLHNGCALEPVDDPAGLLAAARSVESAWSECRWVDWMETGDRECLGGLTGSLRLAGSGLDPLLWVLLLGSLLGIGRGASYGAGRYRVAPA